MHYKLNVNYHRVDSFKCSLENLKLILILISNDPGNIE